MRLYHAGTVEIRQPDIHHGRKNADFGQGFYLTPDREFALRWAGPEAVINEYELEETGLRIVRFERDAAWFDYIFQNRRVRDTLTADVVIGPIANDTIFDTLGIFTSGLLETDVALQLMMIGPAYTQVAVKSVKAARQLTWLGAAGLRSREDADGETEAENQGKAGLDREREEREYQRELAEKMQELL